MLSTKQSTKKIAAHHLMCGELDFMGTMLQIFHICAAWCIRRSLLLLGLAYQRHEIAEEDGGADTRGGSGKAAGENAQ